MKTALICGISGQDGAYLAKHLLDRGYKVIGTSRDAQPDRLNNLTELGINKKIKIKTMSLNDYRSVLSVLSKSEPDEIYNLAGQTSVSLSFEQPVETLESIINGTLNLLEGIRFLNPKIRLYNAGSSECFGDTAGARANEKTSFQPRSPYAVAKACAANLVANYREAYNIYACTGLLFNHESPLRPKRFVTRKIIEAAYKIHLKEQANVMLGNLNIYRDWGWAPDYVEAMYLMLQLEKPIDIVIATGRSVSLKYFVEKVFSYFDLDWQEYVYQDEKLFRPSDITHSAADTELANSKLGWSASKSVEDVIEKMCEAERKRIT